MKILFDFNHPAHVHYFKHSIKQLKSRGDTVFIVARDKEISQELLKLEKISFISRGKGAKSLLGKLFYYFYSLSVLLYLIKKEKVDLTVSFMHPYPVQAAWLARVTSLVFSDTENASLHHRATVPFASEVHTPFTFGLDIGRKQKSFKSFMELAFLNDKHFIPNEKLFHNFKKADTRKKALVRFVSRKSLHDSHHKGITDTDKVRLVEALSKFCNVYISSEVEIPGPIKSYQLNIPVNKIHDFLYSCDFLVGESATMSAESALLGTPAIYIDDEGRGYTDYLEKEYQLIYRVNEDKKGIDKAIAYAKKLNTKSNKKSWKEVTELHRNYTDTSEYILNQIDRLTANSP